VYITSAYDVELPLYLQVGEVKTPEEIIVIVLNALVVIMLGIVMLQHAIL
jgi:hypothetical protein